MKILIINFEYPPLGGGGGVATKHIAEELSHKHEVVVLTTHFDGLPRRDVQGGVVVERVRVIKRVSRSHASLTSLITFIPAALVTGIRLCWRGRFDVINAQFVLPSGLVGRLLAGLFRVPFVLSFIGGDIYDPTKGTSPHRSRVLRALTRWIARGARVCTAISADTRHRAQTMHGVTSSIVVVPLGIQLAPVTPISRSALGLPENVPLAICVGRLIPRKDHLALLDAWQQVPGATLLIVGEGPLREQLQQAIEARGLRERVRLLGFVSEVQKRQLLACADVYVSAAEHEGFGLVFLEAMEAGLPIVATNNGGQLDFLTANENALLVAPKQPALLASAVGNILSDAPLRKRMSQANRQKVQHYSLPVTVGLFEDILVRAVR
jgi:glycosyltransferase involved in cell wall biosynthesis